MEPGVCDYFLVAADTWHMLHSHSDYKNGNILVCSLPFTLFKPWPVWVADNKQQMYQRIHLYCMDTLGLLYAPKLYAGPQILASLIGTESQSW